MKKPGSSGKKSAAKSSYQKEVIYFLIRFFVIMGILLFVELFNPVNQKVITPFTGLLSKVSVFFLQLIGTEAKASGTLIVSPQFAADIKAGCTGIEPVIILVAAILAFPSPWRSKIYGVLLGIIALQAANVIRIVSLVYLGVNHPQYFSDAHTFIWQIVIIALSLFLWMVWAKGMKKNEAKTR
jgi:exosortase H (IPTLxxWG-CTERM-specific)